MQEETFGIDSQVGKMPLSRCLKQKVDAENRFNTSTYSLSQILIYSEILLLYYYSILYASFAIKVSLL